MTPGSRLAMKQRIFASLVGASLFGGVVAPSYAADLGPVPGYRDRYVKTWQPYWDWRARCAYAGYYCLYAEYGYVYHYPFDDRPIARRFYRRRHR